MMAGITYTARIPGHGPRAAVDPLATRLVEQLLDQGAPALRHLNQPANQKLLAQCLEGGLLERGAAGDLHVGPAGLRLAEQQALAELLRARTPGLPGRQIVERGRGGDGEPEDTRPYQFGDPPDRLDFAGTLRRAYLRNPGPPPLPLSRDDLVIQEGAAPVGRAIVFLLDQSGSMARYGKFACARRLALGLRALLRARCPEDRFEVVGFATRATPLSGRSLLEATPRSIGLFDNRATLRLDRAAADLPEHFTNLQGGLRLARRLLLHSGAGDRQVICVTDGEPTAHEEEGQLVLGFPPGPETARRTLVEARRLSRCGLRLSLFGLVDEDAPGLRAFVRRLAHAGSGQAVCCPAHRLGRLVLDRLVGGHAREERT